MKYNELVNEVSTRSGLEDRAEAERATAATLDLLGARLAGQEPADLAAQLPAELQDLVTRHTGTAEKYGPDEFLHLADRTGRVSIQGAEHPARAVFSTIAEFVSEGEMNDLRRQLPNGYASLLE